MSKDMIRTFILDFQNYISGPKIDRIFIYSSFGINQSSPKLKNDRKNKKNKNLTNRQ